MLYERLGSDQAKAFLFFQYSALCRKTVTILSELIFPRINFHDVNTACASHCLNLHCGSYAISCRADLQDKT